MCCIVLILKLASVIWGDNYFLFSFSLQVVKSARMPKENTLQLKTKKKSVKRLQRKHQSGGSKRVCIIHFAKNKSETKVRPLTEYSFSKIKEIASLRQSSNNEESRLDNICQNLPEEFDILVHGNHRKCYQNFTNVSRLKKTVSNVSENEASPYKRRKRSSGITNAASTLFPSDKCLFCNKLSKKVKGKKQFLVKCVTDTTQNSIKLAAKQKKDEKMMGIVNGIDLVAREAHYHNYCLRIYTRSEVRRSLSGDSEAFIMLEAHKNAFDYLCSYIEEHIILHLKVERMTMLRERYLLYLLENHSDYCNENYKRGKLKEKLRKHFGNRIQFWKPSSRGGRIGVLRRDCHRASSGSCF